MPSEQQRGPPGQSPNVLGHTKNLPGSAGMGKGAGVGKQGWKEQGWKEQGKESRDGKGAGTGKQGWEGAGMERAGTGKEQGWEGSRDGMGKEQRQVWSRGGDGAGTAAGRGQGKTPDSDEDDTDKQNTQSCRTVSVGKVPARPPLPEPPGEALAQTPRRWRWLRGAATPRAPWPCRRAPGPRSWQQRQLGLPSPPQKADESPGMGRIRDC